MTAAEHHRVPRRARRALVGRRARPDQRDRPGDDGGAARPAPALTRRRPRRVGGWLRSSGSPGAPPPLPASRPGSRRPRCSGRRPGGPGRSRLPPRWRRLGSRSPPRGTAKTRGGAPASPPSSGSPWSARPPGQPGSRWRPRASRRSTLAPCAPSPGRGSGCAASSSPCRDAPTARWTSGSIRPPGGCWSRRPSRCPTSTSGPRSRRRGRCGRRRSSRRPTCVASESSGCSRPARSSSAGRRAAGSAGRSTGSGCARRTHSAPARRRRRRLCCAASFSARTTASTRERRRTSSAPGSRTCLRCPARTSSCSRFSAPRRSPCSVSALGPGSCGFSP